jgi:hypothetical protein
MGKTAFAMNVAENVALAQQVPVLFVSLEMSSLELADRLLCSVAKVNSHRLRTATLSHDDRLKLVDAAEVLSKAPLFIDDSPSRTVTEIAAAARRIKRRHGGLGLIVIDYLQLIEPDNPKDPRQEQVAKIARRLKGLAREMKVPVLCLAQLNRQAEVSKDNIPRLSHLRESRSIARNITTEARSASSTPDRRRSSSPNSATGRPAKWNCNGSAISRASRTRFPSGCGSSISTTARPSTIRWDFEVSSAREVCPKAYGAWPHATVQRVRQKEPWSLQEAYCARNWLSVAVAEKVNVPNMRPRYWLPWSTMVPSGCSVAVIVTL